MRALGSMVLAAVATAGCSPWLSEAPWQGASGGASLYEGSARPPPTWPPPPAVQAAPVPVLREAVVYGGSGRTPQAPSEAIVEAAAPGIVVLRVPAGAVVTVSCAAPADASRAAAAPRFRPSPYGEDAPAAATPASYKPSPYEETAPPLYRIE